MPIQDSLNLTIGPQSKNLALVLLPPMIFAVLSIPIALFSCKIYNFFGWPCHAEGSPFLFLNVAAGSSLIVGVWTGLALRSALKWRWPKLILVSVAAVPTYLVLLWLVTAVPSIAMNRANDASNALPWEHLDSVAYQGKELLPGIRSGMTPEEFVSAMGPTRKFGIYLPSTERQYPRGSEAISKMNFISLAAWPFESESVTGWVEAIFANRRLLGVSFVPNDGEIGLKVAAPRWEVVPAPRIADCPYLLSSGLHQVGFDQRLETYRQIVLVVHGLKMTRTQRLEDATLQNGSLLKDWGGGRFLYQDPDAIAALPKENLMRLFGAGIIEASNPD